MRLLPPVPLVVVLVLAGCGGGERRDERAQTVPAPRTEPAPETAPDEAPSPPGGDAPRLPPGVPTASDGPAPAGSVAVVERWVAAVRRGDVKRAAATFALPTAVQNGGPVARLRSRAEAIVWNASLPCGARIAEAGGSRGFAVITFTLVERSGGSCGSGVGGTASAAIRVRDGLIAEWYRLPGPVAPPAEPDAPFV